MPVKLGLGYILKKKLAFRGKNSISLGFHFSQQKECNFAVTLLHRDTYPFKANLFDSFIHCGIPIHRQSNL